MSLPKRDGVHDRYYLIHKPDTSPEVLAEADLCIQDVLNGTARENHSAYPTVVRNHNRTPFLPSQLLERYLSKLPLQGFPYEEAVIFCDALRRLVGWEEIRYTLEKYIEKQVQERFFLVGERDDGFTVFPPCTVWPELRPENVDEGLLRFACYVAVCYTVYGQSFESLTTEHILGLVSQLRPDLVKQLKTAGSGKLPKDIQRRKTEHFTATANDAFATIRITAKDATEACYAEILDYLCAVLEQPEFPRSYSIEFRGKEKLYLPIPGLPKKGVHQLFACAVQHPNLHPANGAIDMYDKSLIAHLLPPEMIIKNYIHGDPDCNYEKYLLEFVNASDFFRVKSDGDIYQSPESEENGQCDCISTSYQFDFKLIASKTALQARSILYPSKTEIVKGIIVTSEPKVKNGSIKATRIHAALRGYDFESLRELRITAIKKQGVENDLIELLETLETRKHLLLFFPYKFEFKTKHEFLIGITQIQNALNSDFRCAMQYRTHEVGADFDTYVAFIYDDRIVFMIENGAHLSYIDSVNLTKSPVYMRLLDYCW